MTVVLDPTLAYELHGKLITLGYASTEWVTGRSLC